MTRDFELMAGLEPEWYDGEPDPTAIERNPAPCRHPKYRRATVDGVTACGSCGHVFDPANARRGKNSRDYGNRAELKVARTYGGAKIGHAGGPVDVRGAQFNVQVKTHRRPPPAEWRKAFAAMSASRERIPRLLLRFVMPGGVPPDDYFVIRGSDWLSWFGKDEEARADGE